MHGVHVMTSLAKTINDPISLKGHICFLFVLSVLAFSAEATAFGIYLSPLCSLSLSLLYTTETDNKADTKCIVNVL